MMMRVAHGVTARVVSVTTIGAVLHVRVGCSGVFLRLGSPDKFVSAVLAAKVKNVPIPPR